MTNNNKKILIYDGECTVCTAARDAVAKRDSRHVFELVDAHSTEGKRLQEAHQLDTNASAYVIENGVLRDKSDMALYVLENLNWFEKLVAKIGRLMPKKAADIIYSFLARHRNIFNKRF